MSRIPFHFISGFGDSLGLALKIQREGHPVTWQVDAPEGKHVGAGYVTRAGAPPKGAVIVYDTTKTDGTEFRKAGHLVIGGNPFDRIETDRPFGAQLMKSAGIKIPETYPFKAVPDAVAFLDDVDGAWFVKVSAEVGQCDTYDADDPEDMIRYLEWVETLGPVKPFELQRRASGIEVSTNGWFDGTRFVTPYDLTIEEKKFATGDTGPRTGCESCVVWHASTLRLGDRTVARIADDLRRARYVGPVDLNALVDSQGEPLGLEWTARLGFDSTQAWMHLFEGDLGEQLEAFAAGELPEWEPSDLRHLSGTLRVSVPPYPSEDTRMTSKPKGLPLDPRVVTDRAFDPADVMKGDDGLPAMAGCSGIVGTVNFTGHKLSHVQTRLLETARSLTIPQAHFRTDPISRGARDMAALKTLGLLGR